MKLTLSAAAVTPVDSLSGYRVTWCTKGLMSDFAGTPETLADTGSE